MRSHVRPPCTFLILDRTMKPAEVARIFEETGALLSGHFLLTSGLHSEKYLQCAKVLQWPHHAEALAKALASYFAAAKPQVVISPAIGGIVIGQEVGRALGCRAIFAERENGALRLRRGFSLESGELAVVVEDVITTGGSTLETMEVVKAYGGKVLGALSVVDRSGGKALLGQRYHGLWTLNIPAFSAESCPLCKAGSSPTKPGSRATIRGS
jgi:orotate phosphoribosyltransferase